MSSVITPSPSSRSIVARLDREWCVLRRRPAVLARARSWQVGVAFESLDDLVEATGYRRRPEGGSVVRPSGEESSAGDGVLAGLLFAARHDDLAARVVLQRLLPGIVAGARRWARRVGGEQAALDELLAAAWTVVRTFPVERRPRHLAANLLRDAEYHAFVRATRRMVVLELRPTHHLDAPVEPAEWEAPTTELAELFDAARSLTERDRELARLLLAGTPVGEMAAQLKVSVRTMTNHRDALVHRLRQAARELAVA